MLFILAAVELVFFLLLLSALWWMRLRELSKLPDGRDWWWEKLGLALVDRALLSKALIQLSADSCCTPCLLFGLRQHSPLSMVRLMTSKRVYSKGDLP